MITEDYVSFETAKLLKEKGFDGPCYKVWESHSDSQTLVGAPYFVEGETVVNRESVDAAAKQYAYEYSLNNNVEGYLAPTLQMAMKWLRDIHKIHIQVEAIIPEYYEKDEYVYRFHYKRLKHIPIYNNMSYIDDTQYVSCEEACEAAIKYCLENLI